MPTKQFRGSLAVSLTVDADCHVRLALCINGKDQKQIRSEAEALETAMETAKIERKMESDRWCHRSQQLRVAQAEMGEQRRGSAHHQTYTAPEKARLLDLIDQIYANPSVINKGGAFEDDRRSRGCPYKTVEKWMKAAERRKIAVGCAHTHAKTLLRIDKNSRKVGKYAGMERTLFTNFKQRRARARKTSTKWLVHMAKHIMRIDYPEHALDFQGSKGWAQRFKRRWSICTRKKTNAKNTTWEETEPKLQAYFRTFRRRMRDPAWWVQYKADALAADTPSVDDAVEAEGDVGRQHARAVWDDSPANPAAVTTETTTTGTATPAAASDGAAAETTTSSTATPTATTSPAPRISGKRQREEVPTPRSDEDPDLPWWKRGRGKWGKYLDFQRLNVDQVSPCLSSATWTLLSILWAPYGSRSTN